MRYILARYKLASGQCINFLKSMLSFSSNVSQANARSIKNIFGTEVVMWHSKYLGLSSSILRDKIIIFKPIEQCIKGEFENS